MQNPKGARAPFFLSVCTPRLRDDVLLAGAIEAFQAGHIADALVAAEYVCRNNPSVTAPTILRAKIIGSKLPSLAASAWYASWYTDPENPLLQDAMLTSWLESGACSSAAELGVTFLPGRCRHGTHHSLVRILQQAKLLHVGACWKAGEWIEGRVFDLRLLKPSCKADSDELGVRLIVSDESSQHRYCVSANGGLFRLRPPYAQAEWSLTYAIDAEEQGAQKLMQGSPLVFEQCKLNMSMASTPHSRTNELQSQTSASGVDIIIPVYGDISRVQACLDSVLSSQSLNNTPTQIIVINDDSPESALVKWLQSLAQKRLITLLTNRHNLGFIGACNRGLVHGSVNDALLLNADTLVHGNWIDRLRNALYSSADVASVMPWSNNAEVGSFPEIAVAAPAPDLDQLAQLDSIAASLHAAYQIRDVEIPSCCGFAMLMRRSSVQQIGVLDAVELNRGYLEEVDWCMRARAAGHRHLLATGVFVAHTGSASFQTEKRLRVQQNRKILVARYPHYYPEYAGFLRDDPIRGDRRVFHHALEQADSPWLARAVSKAGSSAEFARAVPAPLPSACVRLAIWQHRITATSAAKVLALARIVASRPELKLRLLIIGEANEALWHTGVVDVIPEARPKVISPLNNSTLVGLSACAVLLGQSLRSAPSGIPHAELNAQFDPQAWLDDWLRQRAMHNPTIETIKT